MSIETIYIVHHTHIDFGYTDHQQTAMELLTGYVDEALDAIDRGRGFSPDARFRWTQEVFLPLERWWRRVGARERRRLLDAIGEGSFEVGAMPVNTSCFADEREWIHMLDLLPKALHAVAAPRCVMQNDINGISRRGLELAWDRGARYLWMGPNSYYGMPPEPAPFAFYWQLAPGKRVLVWCNSSYNDGTFLFNENWRQGPVPAAHDLNYRRPEPGDIFPADGEGLARAHALLCERLRLFTGGAGESAGTDGFTKSRTRTDYPYRTLVTSVAGQWRCDNDPPFYALSDFVEAWNRRGYRPRLKLATVSQALAALEAECGGELPVREGVWTDFWSNGLATSPAEMACARDARRALTAACAPTLGRLTPAQRRRRKCILDDLMRVDEHTFAAWDSAGNPDSPNARAQLAEKRVFAYRALEGAKMLLSERVRAAVHAEFGTVTVANLSPFERVCRLDVPANCLRGEYASLEDAGGRRWALSKRAGFGNFLRPESEADFGEDNVARTFGDVCPDMRVVSEAMTLKPWEVRTLRLSAEAGDDPAAEAAPEVRTDALGWPEYVAFPGAPCALVDGAAGEFRSVRARGVAPRWTFKDVFDADDPAERERLRGELFVEEGARYEPTQCSRERGQITFTQRFSHPSLRLGRRTLSVDCISRRARLEVKLDRLPDYAPEIFYIGFRASVGADVPLATLAGQPFRALADSLSGACRDFICIDGWLRYGEGVHWHWFARDSALVCIGSLRPSARSEQLPDDPREFWAQVFDNTWDTNFDPNSWGRMSFRFDLAAGEIERPLESFEAGAWEPSVLVRTRDLR